jgi:hypothetical protein
VRRTRHSRGLGPGHLVSLRPTRVTRLVETPRSLRSVRVTRVPGLGDRGWPIRLLADGVEVPSTGEWVSETTFGLEIRRGGSENAGHPSLCHSEDIGNRRSQTLDKHPAL